jgi:hypothetical protein
MNNTYLERSNVAANESSAVVEGVRNEANTLGLFTTRRLGSSRQKKRLFFGTCAVVFAAVVSILLFYGCKKDGKEPYIPTEEHGRIIGEAERFYALVKCKTADGKDGKKCMLVTYKPESNNVCSNPGSTCQAEGKDSVIVGYLSDVIAYETPELYSPYTLRITAEILRDNNTHKPLSLYYSKFDVMNSPTSTVVKASWSMVFTLTASASDGIENAIATGNTDLQHAIVSSMDSYVIYVDGVLVNSAFSKTIYVDADKVITIDYNHIQGVIWKYLVALLD